MVKVPTYKELMNPVIEALTALGGSGTIGEIEDKVVEQQHYPDEVVDAPHKPGGGGATQLSYQLGWARTYLKNFGAIDNSEKGVWLLKASGKVDPAQVVAKMMADRKTQKTSKSGKPEDEPQPQEAWRAALSEVLTKVLTPDGFERLVRRILRELGYDQVEVTGKSGDGGIDGRGVYPVGGLLSLHVIFQCKRYSGMVGSGAIRDFRGAMSGRTDKGLFITTGTFSSEAKKEAVRDGVPQIDLVDGMKLGDILERLQLGMKTQLVKQVTVDAEFFKAI